MYFIELSIKIFRNMDGTFEILDVIPQLYQKIFRKILPKTMPIKTVLT